MTSANTPAPMPRNIDSAVSGLNSFASSARISCELRSRRKSGVQGLLILRRNRAAARAREVTGLGAAEGEASALHAIDDERLPERMVGDLGEVAVELQGEFATELAKLAPMQLLAQATPLAQGYYFGPGAWPAPWIISIWLPAGSSAMPIWMPLLP